MKISQIKYNLKFGNKPEGKFFLEHYKEVDLSPDILGRYYQYTGDSIHDLKNKSLLLIGLSAIYRKNFYNYTKFNEDLNHEISTVYSLVFLDEHPSISNHLAIQVVKDTFSHTYHIDISTFKSEFKLIGESI